MMILGVIGRDSWVSASAGVVVSYASKDKSYLKQGVILSLGKKSFLKFDKEAMSFFLLLRFVHVYTNKLTKYHDKLINYITTSIFS